jgi:hypothetical protein
MAIPLPPGSSPLFTDSRTELSSNLVPCLWYLGTHHIENTALLLLRSCLLLQKCVYRAVAHIRPWYIRLSRGRCVTTALHATILKLTFRNQDMRARTGFIGLTVFSLGRFLVQVIHHSTGQWYWPVRDTSLLIPPPVNLAPCGWPQWKEQPISSVVFSLLWGLRKSKKGSPYRCGGEQTEWPWMDKWLLHTV